VNRERRGIVLGVVALGPPARRAGIVGHDQTDAADSGIGTQRRQSNRRFSMTVKVSSALPTDIGRVWGLCLAQRTRPHDLSPPGEFARL
jgi:hypothetical protein